MKNKRKLSKEDFLSMNETERELWLAIPKKKFEFTFKNRWKQYSAYRIDFAPSLSVIKQLKSTGISIEWFGLVASVTINKLEGEELDFGKLRNPEH